jgi:hypothetical protein
MDRLSRQDGGHFGVTVDDLSTGGEASFQGGSSFITASIVKVDILATLLYDAQGDDRTLTADEQEVATTMIEDSDNDSATDLYDEVDGATGMDEVNGVLGLTRTSVGTAGFWGLTSTTTNDQVRLLRAVFTQPSVLTAASQDYIRQLMSDVESDQRWGVTAAASEGTRSMVKNGWLPDPDLWVINSIGEVTHDGQRLLIAVMSDDNASEYSGISEVQTVASTAAAIMTR